MKSAEVVVMAKVSHPANVRLRETRSASSDPATQSRIASKTACSGAIMESLPVARAGRGPRLWFPRRLLQSTREALPASFVQANSVAETAKIRVEPPATKPGFYRWLQSIAPGLPERFCEWRFAGSGLPFRLNPGRPHRRQQRRIRRRRERRHDRS